MTGRKHIIEIKMGDWSKDGHGKTESLHVWSNLSSIQIRAAFAEGANKIGLDISEHCGDYEDNSLTKEQLETLRKSGFDPMDCQDYKWSKEQGILESEDRFSLTTDEFAKIYIFTVKQGNPSFEYEELGAERIEIGGYGLF